MCAPTKQKAAAPAEPPATVAYCCQLCGEPTPLDDVITRSRGFRICAACNAGYESGAYCAAGIAEETKAFRAEHKPYGHCRKPQLTTPYPGAAVGIIHETRQHNRGLSIIDAPPMAFDSILRMHGYIPPPPLPKAESPQQRQTRVQRAADDLVELIRAERIAAKPAATKPTTKITSPASPAADFDPWEAANY